MSKDLARISLAPSPQIAHSRAGGRSGIRDPLATREIHACWRVSESSNVSSKSLKHLSNGQPLLLRCLQRYDFSSALSPHPVDDDFQDSRRISWRRSAVLFQLTSYGACAPPTLYHVPLSCEPATESHSFFKPSNTQCSLRPFHPCRLSRKRTGTNVTPLRQPGTLSEAMPPPFFCERHV